MANEKNMRMEEIESGQQEMQEKIAQMTKMVTRLTKGKRITADPSLQSEPRWHRSIHCAKFERPMSTRKIEERTVWTVKIRRHAAKVQSLGQKAERDRRCE